MSVRRTHPTTTTYCVFYSSGSGTEVKIRTACMAATSSLRIEETSRCCLIVFSPLNCIDSHSITYLYTTTAKSERAGASFISMCITHVDLQRWAERSFWQGGGRGWNTWKECNVLSTAAARLVFHYDWKPWPVQCICQLGFHRNFCLCLCGILSNLRRHSLRLSVGQGGGSEYDCVLGTGLYRHAGWCSCSWCYKAAFASFSINSTNACARSCNHSGEECGKEEKEKIMNWKKKEWRWNCWHYIYIMYIYHQDYNDLNTRYSLPSAALVPWQLPQPYSLRGGTWWVFYE